MVIISALRPAGGKVVLETMKTRAIWAACVLCGMAGDAGAAQAVSLGSTKESEVQRVRWDEVKLRSGEILRGVTVMSQTPTAVTVAVGTTMRQVKKEELPEAMRKLYPIDLEADSRREAKVRAGAEQRKAQQASAATDKERRSVRNGVRIVSNAHTQFPGVVELVVRNEGATPAYVDPSTVLGRVSDGSVIAGQFVKDDGKPTGSSVSLAGNASRTLNVFFFWKGGALTSVDEVYWKP